MTGVAKWIYGMPSISLHRLARINLAATSSAHIILALSYGIQDRYIGALNRMIVGLLLARHRARHRGDLAREERVERKLQELHAVINEITGTEVDNPDAGSACKAVRRMTA